MPVKWPIVSSWVGADNTKLVQAAKRGDAARVEEHLGRSGADANFRDRDGWTPLMSAARYGRIEVVKALLDVEDIDVNLQTGNGSAPLHSAAEHGHMEVVKALLGENGINVNLQTKSGLTPLHLAGEHGRIEVVKALLGAGGVDVNLQTKDGWTPLHYAASSGSTVVVKLLLGANGIKVNLPSQDGWTPLMSAARYGHIEVVKALLGVEDINVNLQAKNGSAPLHSAAEHGHMEVVKVLLGENGINVNLQTKNGSTPLHFAAEQGRTDLVKALLAAEDIDVNLRNKIRRTPLEAAIFAGHTDAAKILRQYAAGKRRSEQPTTTNGGWAAIDAPSQPPTAEQNGQATTEALTAHSNQPASHAAEVHSTQQQPGTAAACGNEHLELVGAGALKAERLMQLLQNPELHPLKRNSLTLTAIIGTACKVFPHKLAEAAGEVILFLDHCHLANEYCRWKVARVVARLKALQPALIALQDTLLKRSLEMDRALISSFANTLVGLIQVLVELVVLILEFTKIRQNRQAFLKRAAFFLAAQGHKCELDALDIELQSCLAQLMALLSIHQFTSEAAAALGRYQNHANSEQVNDDRARRKDLQDLAGSLLRTEGGVEALRTQLKDQTTTLLRLEAWLQEVHSSSIEMQLHLPRIEEKLDYALQLLIRQDVKSRLDQRQKQQPTFIISREEIVVPEDSLHSGVAGGYGTVLKAERDGSAVALKIYNYQTAAASHSLKEQETIVMEAFLLQQANHHNIVRCFGVLYDPLARPGRSLQGSLVMEWVEGGNLFQWLQRHPAVSLRQRVSLAAQVAAGMKYIHAQKIRHGDLKPENVLVCEVDGRQEAKICDFGLAVYNTTLSTKKMQASSGTVAYCSPERLAVPGDSMYSGQTASGPSYEDDVYAFGIIMHVIITSARPYPLTERDSVLRVQVVSGKLRPHIETALESSHQPSHESCLRNYIDLAKRCWCEAAEERPRFAEIYNHLHTILHKITVS